MSGPLRPRRETGIDVLDDTGGLADRGLVDGLLGELQPADPVAAVVGDDLDALVVLVLGVDGPRFVRSQAHFGSVTRFRRTVAPSYRYTWT
jgi:hypothetical protein